jgi:hypothetical protein
MSSSSRHSPLIFVPEDGQGPVIRLQQIELGRGPESGERREKFLQELVHSHPDIIPMQEIEPAFTPLISICRELETPAGYLDNLWLTPDGGIVLGECKLVRNSQSRREVVTQALDYARAICEWNYEDLERSFRKSSVMDGSLYNTVKEKSDLTLDEEQFIDAVERRLRAGHLMTLVICDGIQEGAEALTSFLQLHAGSRVGMALIDLSIWRGIGGGWVIAPRVPMKTVIVERGVVIVEPTGQVKIEPPRGTKAGKLPRAFSASETEFFDQMEQRRPGLPSQVKSFIDGLLEFGIAPEFRKALVLRWQPSADFAGSLGYIESTGKVWTGDACGTAKRLNKPAAGDEYLQAIARAVGGTVRHDHVVGADGRIVDVEALLAHGDAWKQAITQFVSATKPVNN